MKVVTLAEFDSVIVDTAVQEKAIAFSTDSRLLEVARAKLVRLAQRAGLMLKQAYEREGRQGCRRRCAARRASTCAGCCVRSCDWASGESGCLSLILRKTLFTRCFPSPFRHPVPRCHSTISRHLVYRCMASHVDSDSRGPPHASKCTIKFFRSDYLRIQTK